MSDQMCDAIQAALGWLPSSVTVALYSLIASRHDAVERGDDVRERACLLAIRAVVDSELGAPSLADLRAEAEAAVEQVASVMPPKDAYATAARTYVANGDASALLDVLVSVVCDAHHDGFASNELDALAAIEAVARWRRAGMEEGKGT